MDAFVQLDSFAQEKPRKKSAGGEGEDGISQLPDGVLHHILSFLSTKDAIRTSALSTRWQHLWTSISDIDLDEPYSYSSKSRDDNLNCGASFLDFVDRVLLLHDASTIKRFRLAFSVQVSSSRVNSWISVVVKHKIQELDLGLPTRVQFELPCCLFTCESLVVLKLEMDRYLKIPSSIDFPNLKTLAISLVTFSDENSLSRLLSSSPVLEELALLDCSWVHIKSLTIRIPTLKSLTFCLYPLLLLEEVLLDCEIKIYAENLTYLNCKSNVTVDLLLYDHSLLSDAHINIWNQYASREDVAHRALKLLNSILHVKYLTISDDTLSSIFFADNLQNGLHTFGSLIDLVMESEISPHTAVILIEFLQKLPNLESLDIAAGFNPDYLFDEDLILRSVPCCLKSRLRTFSFTGLEGKAEEIQLLQFFLQNATSLERMTIYCLEYLSKDTKKREEISNQLERLPRGSEGCVLELV